MKRKVSSRFKNQNGHLMDLALEVEAKTNQARQVYFLERYQMDDTRSITIKTNDSLYAW